MAITRTQILNNRRNAFVDLLAEKQAAKDTRLADQGKIDKINDGLPLVEQLIQDTLDANFKADLQEIHAEYSKIEEDWNRDIDGWDEEISKLTAMIAEIDRLLGG